MVAGAGRSGLNAARLLQIAGYTPVLYDENAGLDKASLIRKLDGNECEIILGELTPEAAARMQFCASSPGIPLTRPFVKVLKEAGVPIISEIALAYHFHKGRLIAVTGTNGKTTTTALVGHILRGCFDKVFVLGNIGHAWSEEVLETSDDSITVVEMSSFQMESLPEVDPEVSIITKITPDHLDRHGMVAGLLRGEQHGETAVGRRLHRLLGDDFPIAQDLRRHGRTGQRMAGIGLDLAADQRFLAGKEQPVGGVKVQREGRQDEFIDPERPRTDLLLSMENVQGEIAAPLALGKGK